MAHMYGNLPCDASSAKSIMHIRKLCDRKDAELASFLTETQLVNKKSVQRPVPPGGSPALVPYFHWVIKNEHGLSQNGVLENAAAMANHVSTRA